MLSFVRFLQRVMLAASFVVFAVLALPSTAEAQPAPIKIAVVNLDFIVAQSPAGKELQSRLQNFQMEIRDEIDRRGETARGIRNQITEGGSSLSEANLTELQKQYEDAGIAMKRYQDDKEREGKKMQEEGLREVEKQLEPIFTAIREEEGYDLILNNVPGVVVMVSDRVEISRQVLDRLNAAAGN
jgi:Skp family chaperone for outer membrane proteins